MILNKFCFCWDLRRGAVIFAWLQMMMSALGIAVLVANYENIWYSSLLNGTAASAYYYIQINYIAKVSIAFEVIKAITCIPLSFGIIKRNHMFYQPWLLVFGFENAVCSTGACIAFIILAHHYPLMLLAWFFYAFIIAIRWYLWICIRTIYKKDMNPSVLQYEDVESVPAESVPLQYEQIYGKGRN